MVMWLLVLVRRCYWCLVRQWIHVPAVDVLWRCLFQFIVRVVYTALIYRDRYAQCQTVQGRRQPCHGAEDVSLGPVQQTTEIPQLQSIDEVFDVFLVQVQQFGYTP